MIAGAASLVCAIGVQAQRPAPASRGIAAPHTAAPHTAASRASAPRASGGARPIGRKAALPLLKAVGSVKQVMASLIDPHADAVWASVGTIIDESGVDERRPRTDAEWAAVSASALALAESGNLLMIEGRAKDRDAWLRMSRALVDAGEVAWKAAEARDVQALMDAGEGITSACDTCHGLYWTEEAGDAAAARAAVADLPRGVGR